MAFGSHPIKDIVVSKFDMHTFASNMMVDEVNCIAVKYGIPLDLHPRVPSSTMTVNELSEDAIVAADMFEFLKFLIAGGVRIRRGTALRPNEKVVEHGDAHIIAAKEKKKGQDALKKFAGKLPNTGGPSQHVKKKKTAPITLGLSEYEDLTSHPIDAKTLHSTYPFNTVAPDPEHEVANVAENEDNKINSCQYDNHIEITSPRASTHPSRVNINASVNRAGSGGRVFTSSSEASGRNTFLDRNTSSDQDIGLFLFLIFEFLPAYAGWEAGLSEYHMAMEKEKEDSLDKSKGQEERIKELEEALAEKPDALNLLPSVVKRLLSSFEYKKSLSQPFNLAIAVRWLEGVKVDRTDEEVQAILATTDNYDPNYSATFHSSFEALFTKKYSYVQKLKEVYRLPLGDLQNIWPDSEGPTLGGGPLAD
ncbi:hypothetical protein Tco_1294006 [Tanacetum coccineum]